MRWTPPAARFDVSRGSRRGRHTLDALRHPAVGAYLVALKLRTVATSRHPFAATSFGSIEGLRMQNA